MARLGINTGSAANDNTGSTLRAAGGIINDNFLEVYTYLGAGSTTVLSAPLWSSTNVGINTLRNVGIGTTNPRFTLEVGAVGASGTTLFVNGDARVTGIVTIGPASITLNGITNTVNIGTGITINGSTGIISATAIVLGGTTLTGAAVTFITAGSGISVNQGTGNVTITATGGGSSQFVTTAAGIHTLSNVGIGTTNPTSKLTVSGDGTFTGVVTATTFIGNVTGTATSTTNIPNLIGNIVSIGNNTSLGSITSTALRVALTSSTGTGDAVFATSPVLLTPALGTPASGILNNCTFPTLNQNTSGTASGLTGTPNITVGVATASSLNVGTGGTIITTTTAGLVGVGTTNPTSKLTVSGDAIFTGVVTATTFIGSLTGTATTSTSAIFATIAGISTFTSEWILGADQYSNYYTFTGPGLIGAENDPVLYLARGQQYKFTNTMNAHPFRIQSTPNGSAGTEYNDGITNNNVQNGTLTWNVQFDTPNILYYQCTAHGSMGGIIYVTPRNEPAVGVRTAVTATTGSIGIGSTSNLNITGFKTYSLLKVGITSAAWVVLYTDSTSRSNDASRSYLTDPTPGSGVIAEVRTISSGISTFIMSPGVIGWNNDVSVASTIYARVTNNESSTSSGIGVTLTVVKLED